MHEFEALVFANAEVLAKTEYLHHEVRREMSEIALAFQSPEYINGDEPPGKRLERRTKFHGGRYSKELQGNLLALEIGIEAMRAHCQHFNEWIDTLQARASLAA